MMTRPCCVRRDLRRERHELLQHLALGLAGRHRGGQPVGDGVEAVEGPQAQAAVGHADHPRLAELPTDLGGQDHAALVVQSVWIGPDEAGPLLCHGSPTACAEAPLPCRCVPPYAYPWVWSTTSPHHVGDLCRIVGPPRWTAACLAGTASRPQASRSGRDGQRRSGARGLRRHPRPSGPRAPHVPAQQSLPRQAASHQPPDLQAIDRGPADQRAAPARPAARSARLRQVAEEGGEEVVEGDAGAGGDGLEVAEAGVDRRAGRAARRRPSGRGRRTGTGRRRGCGAGRCRRPCAPSTVTSPGPRPAKHTAADHGVTAPARPCAPAPSTPSSPSAAAHTSPSQCEARPTSSSQSGSPAGTITSTQSTSPGTTSTAPPPLRRRTTSIVDAGAHVGRRAARCRARAPGRSDRPPTPRARPGPGRRARGSRRRSASAARPASSRATSVAGWR